MAEPDLSHVGSVPCWHLLPPFGLTVLMPLLLVPPPLSKLSLEPARTKKDQVNTAGSRLLSSVRPAKPRSQQAEEPGFASSDWETKAYIFLKERNIFIQKNFFFLNIFSASFVKSMEPTATQS